MKVYLCGPINGCTDEDCKVWRNAAKLEFPNSIDPMRRDYRGKEDVRYREIVELDKRDIEAADVVLVNYVGPSVGTSMEIYHAWLKGIPVVIVHDAATIISPWLRYHSTRLTTAFSNAYDWIKQNIDGHFSDDIGSGNTGRGEELAGMGGVESPIASS